MKNSKLLWILLLLTLSACDGCEERDWTTLPPETQTGANTFGCYVNGELFVKGKEAPFIERRLRAEYQVENKLLMICCYSSTQMIYMEMKEPEVNISKAISMAYLLPEEKEGVCDCRSFSGKEVGEVTLTKLDTLNKIVSGRFHFQAQCSDYSLQITGDSIRPVTNGRFDVVMYVNNN